MTCAEGWKEEQSREMKGVEVIKSGKINRSGHKDTG